MRRKGFSFIELAYTLGLFALLIAVGISAWQSTFREIQSQYLLNSAVQGVLYVLNDARGKSVQEGKVYRVTIVDNNSIEEPLSFFAAGIRESTTTGNYLLPRASWGLSKSSQTLWGGFINLQYVFDPDAKFYYIFGAWTKETDTSYELITTPTTITISVVGKPELKRVIRIEGGMPKDVTRE